MLDTPTLEYAYSLYSCTSAIYSREKFEHCIQYRQNMAQWAPCNDQRPAENKQCKNND